MYVYGFLIFLLPLRVFLVVPLIQHFWLGHRNDFLPGGGTLCGYLSYPGQYLRCGVQA